MRVFSIRKVFLIFVISITTYAHADSLSYSGRLVNTNGSPVVGPVDLKFDLANTANTSSILCTQQINNVILTNGVFHVKLDFNCGAQTLAQTLAGINSPDAAAVRVTNLTASKAYSFQELHAVPSAQVAHGLSKLNANNNEVLTWTGSKWEPKPVTGATGGTVTDITAGTGLSGGTITNSGTIAIANGGVTDTHLAGNISRSKLAAGTANSVVVTNGAGIMTEVPQLPVSSGGTGSNTAAGARTNLGLGDAAVATIGYGAGQVMPGEVPICLAHQKLQMNLGPTFWSCANDNDSLDATKLPLGGGTMSGAIAMGNNLITGLATPVAGTDAATKDYVDTKVTAAPGDNLGNHTATTTLALGSNKITIGDGTWSSPSITFTNSLNTGIFNNGGVMGFSAGGGLAMNLSSSTLILNGSFAPYMRLGGGTFNATNPTYAFGGDPNTGMFNLSTDILGFTTGGVEKMRIQATGEVAIGKTTAAEKLDVAGNIALDGALRLKSDTANYVDLRAPAGLGGGLSYIFPATAGSSGQALVTNGAGVLSWATTATTASAVGGDLSGTIANAQLIADAVGTSEIANGSVTYAKLNLTDGDIPLAKLNGASDTTKYLKGDKTWGTFITDVLSSTFATVTPNNAVIANADSLLTVVNKTQGQINALKSADNNFLVKNGTDTISGAVSVSGSLKIPATPSGADLTDVANVQYVQNYVGTFGQWTKTGANLSYSAGNVGVGIASPWDQFMVYKANNVATASIVSDNTSTTTARYPTIAVKNFGGGGAGSIGNPVIELVNLRGNSSAAAVLKSGDTLGGISFSGSTATNGNYKEGSNIRALATQNYTTTAAGGSLLFATTANSTVTPIDRMIIDQNGYVGVGTLAPSALMHLNSTGGQMMLVTDSDSLHTDVNFSAYIRAQDSGANNVWYIGDGSVSAKALNILTYQAGYPIYFGTSAGTAMTVSDDKVGIGTVSPTNRLHVEHAVNNAYVAKISNGGGDGQGLLINGSDGDPADTQPLLSVSNYDLSKSMLHVQGNGNVGIGTSAPAHKLQVNGTFRVNSPYGTDTGAAVYSSSAGGYGQLEIGHSNVDTDVSFLSMHSFNNTAWTQGIQGSSFVISNTSGATKSYNDAERFTITIGGNVGINTITPTYRLDVNGNARVIGLTDASDVRLKNTIVPLRPEEDLEKILMLRSVSYFWNDRTQDPDKQIGYIAQEMEKIYPELVETDTKGMKSVNYSHMVSPITNAIKALHTKQTRDIASLKSENEKLRDENAKMKKENDEIKSRLDRLEKALLKQK